MLERMAVAVFKEPHIEGTATVVSTSAGVRIRAEFTKLPVGKHGFHIHRAGDLRGEGCKGACSHWHVGPPSIHGDRPHGSSTEDRHTGDLGNIEVKGTTKSVYTYNLKGVKPADLWGRALIVHADEDDLGKGPFEDSLITGHSGARIGCALFGRSL